MPSPVRPQRPLRWLALAWLTGSIGSRRTLSAVAVAGDAGGARVDHVLDAGHGQGRLGHVRGEHDPPPRVRLEHAVLLGVRQPGVERQDLGVPQLLLISASAVSRISRSPERKTRMLAGPLRLELVDGVADRGDLVPVGFLGVLFEEGPVAHLHGQVRPLTSTIGASPKCRENRSGSIVAEVITTFRSGRREQELGEVAEQEVDVEGPLVGLVDDDRVVRAQLAVRLDLGEQDAVRHQLDEGGVRVDLVGEADLPADRLAEGVPSSSATRSATVRAAILRGCVCARSCRAPRAQLQADLGDLRGLPGARLTGDDHDLVGAYRLQDVALLLADGELLRYVTSGHPGGPRWRYGWLPSPPRRRSRRGRPAWPRACGCGGRLRDGGRAGGRRAGRPGPEGSAGRRRK